MRESNGVWELTYIHPMFEVTPELKSDMLRAAVYQRLRRYYEDDEDDGDEVEY